MAMNCNLKLKEIADVSNVRQSAVPLFICDEDLRICTKSVGAERLIPSPRAKTSIAKYFSKDAVARIKSDDMRIYRTSFADGKNGADAFVCRGEIGGEVYYAVILKLNVSFCPYPMPKYLDDACEHLAEAVHELLNVSASDYKKLEVCCMRISRLCDFRSAAEAGSDFSHINISSVNSVMETIEAECADALTAIGGTAEFTFRDNALWAADILTRNLYILLSTIIVSMVTVSSKGRVRVEFSVLDDSSGTGEISVFTDYHIPSNGRITSLDEFALAAVPLRLEIAALQAMIDTMGVEAVCESAGDVLKISLRFAIRRVGDMVLRAPSYVEDRRYLAKLLSELCRIAS